MYFKVKFSSFLPQNLAKMYKKTQKKEILTTVWSAQHSYAGRNIQQQPLTNDF